jgi:hypothetical protein
MKTCSSVFSLAFLLPPSELFHRCPQHLCSWGPWGTWPLCFTNEKGQGGRWMQNLGRAVVVIAIVTMVAIHNGTGLVVQS